MRSIFFLFFIISWYNMILGSKLLYVVVVKSSTTALY
jgi:hypothetical protein